MHDDTQHCSAVACLFDVLFSQLVNSRLGCHSLVGLQYPHEFGLQPTGPTSPPDSDADPHMLRALILPDFFHILSFGSGPQHHPSEECPELRGSPRTPLPQASTGQLLRVLGSGAVWLVSFIASGVAVASVVVNDYFDFRSGADNINSPQKASETRDCSPYLAYAPLIAAAM